MPKSVPLAYYKCKWTHADLNGKKVEFMLSGKKHVGEFIVHVRRDLVSIEIEYRPNLKAIHITITVTEAGAKMIEPKDKLKTAFILMA